jgi:flagellar biosynthesis/type III secretory pathway protein FliH
MSSVADPVDPVPANPMPVDLRVLETPAWAASLSAAGTASTVAGASRARKVLKNANVVAVPSRVQQQAEAERKARAEAERLAELREIAAAARAVGYRAGVEETLAAGQNAAVRGAAALERLADTIEGRQQAEVDATAETVVTAALEIAAWVLRRELSDAGRSLLARLEAGMTALLPSPTTRIAVSRDDHAVVSEWAEGRGRVGTTVLADARLAPGDAVVITDAGSADLTVAAALRAAGEALGLGGDEAGEPRP